MTVVAVQYLVDCRSAQCDMVSEKSLCVLGILYQVQQIFLYGPTEQLSAHLSPHYGLWV